MERRNLVAGLAILIVGMFALTGAASAHVAHHKKAKKPASSHTSDPETCVVHALPSSFMDQGEFGTASSVADVIEVECEEVYAEKAVTISGNELYSRCDGRLWWADPTETEPDGGDQVRPAFEPSTGPSTTVTLDNDGNATAVVFGGPSCAAGESLIAAHLQVAPFSTATTAFTVLPPRPTEPGVFATPAAKVEDETTSSVATIIQVEFPPVFAEEPVNINAAQLYARCHREPKIRFIEMTPEGPWDRVNDEEEVSGVSLDNDGNAFVVVIGTSSCASGTSLIEASLENAPYTTYTNTFTVLPPQPTFPEEPPEH
ncbi:MAG TPA: hypothetical protein VMI13_11965 [Solirubrobacteraceae bacterium]|nr:hypothetical protein [Solirubrobacteraceae bacterium]